MAHALANQGRAHPYTLTPLPESRARAGPGFFGKLIEVPGAGPTSSSRGGPTPLNRKIGVPTLPFIA